jgi:hypothetical protein
MRVAVLVAIVLLFSYVPLGNTVSAEDAVTTTTTTCYPGASPFTMTGTAWGTSGEPVSPGPGSENVPLTVTLLYDGACSLTTIDYELVLSSPFTGANGASNLTLYGVNIAPYSIISETYYVNVSSAAVLATYNLTLSVDFSTSNWFGLIQTLGVVVPLKGTADIAFASNVANLVAGTVNKVTLSVSNIGSGTASLITPQLTSSGQVTLLSQLTQITELSPSSSATQTLSLFVPSSFLGSAVTISLSASYYDAYSVFRTATQTLGFYVTSATAVPFEVTGASWGSSDPTPQPGDRDVPLVLTLLYSGVDTVASLKGTLSLPTGFTNQSGGSNSTSSYGGTISSDQLVQMTFYLNLASSEPAGSYTFPLLLTWSTAQASGIAQSLTASPPSVGQPPNTSAYALSVAQENDSITDGVLSTVGFEVTNTGTRTVTSPAFQLEVSSPLVLMSTSAPPKSSLAPGQSETFIAVVSASPSSTPGIYGATLSVSFTDQSGSQHTESFPAGFVLNGVVQLIVQDEVVSQTSTSLSVSGSLLNEGGVSAYYAQVTGSVKGFLGSNATAYYVGEIDPDSPLSFTITLPLPAPNSPRTATLLLNVEYLDSFGENHTITIPSATSLESAGQFFASQTSTATQTNSSGNWAFVVGLVVIGAIAVVGVVGAIMVSRRRAAMRPAKVKEQKII